jgi:hypothetical protein
VSVSESTGDSRSLVLVPELYGDGRDFFVSILKSDLLEMAISTLEVVFKIISGRMCFCPTSL